MQTKSIDSIVREVLIEEGKTLHWYVKYLHFMLEEYQRFSKHHRAEAKKVRLTKNSYNRAPFPSDLMMILDLGVEEGERVLPLTSADNLNKLYKYDAKGNKIKYDDYEVDYLFDNLNIIEDGVSTYFDISILHRGGLYGTASTDDQSFTVDFINQEFVFSNNMRYETVLLTYAADPVSTTQANLVRHEYVDVLKAFAKMRCKETDKMTPLYEKQMAKQEYINRKREMRSYVYPIRMADLISAQRKGTHRGLKN